MTNFMFDSRMPGIKSSNFNLFFQINHAYNSHQAGYVLKGLV